MNGRRIPPTATLVPSTFALIAPLLLTAAPSIAAASEPSDWYTKTLRAMGYQQCLRDYDVDPLKVAKESARFQQSIGIDLWETMDRARNRKGWQVDFGSIKKTMSDECFDAAKRLGSGTSKINYQLGGSWNWYHRALIVIAQQECLKKSRSPMFPPDIREYVWKGLWGSKEPRTTEYDLKIARQKKTFKTDFEQFHGGKRGEDDCRRHIEFASNLPSIKSRLENQTLSSNAGSSVRPKSPQDKNHESCLQARDYAGCIQVLSGKLSAAQVSSPRKTEECDDSGWCIATNGRDRYNLKKREGWVYKEFEGGQVLYLDPVVNRVLHDGKASRYVAQRQVYRYYESPTAGTPGSTQTIGSATTNCYSYGSTISCTTSPPTTIYTPGTSGTPGGIRSIERLNVLDCKDMTRAFYVNGRLRGSWKKANASGYLFSKCASIDSLPMVQMKL